MPHCLLKRLGRSAFLRSAAPGKRSIRGNRSADILVRFRSLRTGLSASAFLGLVALLPAPPVAASLLINRDPAIALLAATEALADQAGRKHPENDPHARPAVRTTVGLRDADIVENGAQRRSDHGQSARITTDIT